jgi:hypothetical protein
MKAELGRWYSNSLGATAPDGILVIHLEEGGERVTDGLQGVSAF